MDEDYYPAYGEYGEYGYEGYDFYNNSIDFGALYDYTEYLYPGYDFERPVYLFIWEIMVLVTTIFNVLVIIVLVRKGMAHNATNTVLIAIAVSDSLTGLVTLPTYIYVYQQFQDGGQGGQDVYILTKEWCEAFMISKYFLSKSFHTVSIWLTVFLGLQRYISVRFPFKAQSLFSNVNTIVVIVAIFLLAPVLHIYHLFDRKTEDFMCSWRLEEDCRAGCAYLWLTFLLMHFLPCVLLVLLTVLMLVGLVGSAEKMRSMTHSNRDSSKRRAEENRRISFIVVAVVIIFLIPEIPYGAYLLVNVVRRHAGLNVLPLERNRAFHCAYEIMLVLSFHANFWVYVLGNKRFRAGLRRLLFPVQYHMYTMIGRRLSSFRSSRQDSSLGTEGKTVATEFHSKSSLEMKRSNTIDHHDNRI